jgi:lysophospholipase L1-like esterase
VATLVVLVAVNIALLAYLGLRPTPEDRYAGRPSPAEESPALASSPTTPAAKPTAVPVPVLAVYGDGYSRGSDLGGQGPAGWPALVAEQLGAQLSLDAVSRTGYVSTGTSGQDFAGLVAASPVPDAAVTVIFGSRNDLGQAPTAVGQRAAETFSLIRQTSPSTRLVVVGPTWSDADVPAEISAERDAVKAAAEQAGATFVDPLEDGWFRSPSGLIASDGVSPTDAGHQFIASALAPPLSNALAG